LPRDAGKTRSELRLGIKEGKSQPLENSSQLFESGGGPYEGAFTRFRELAASKPQEEVFKRYWERSCAPDATRIANNFEAAVQIVTNRVLWIILRECQMAVRWQNLEKDFLQAHRDYEDVFHHDGLKIQKIISELRYYVEKHPYLMGHSASESFSKFFSPSKPKRARQPNMNTKSGYQYIDVGGERVQNIEFRFTSWLSFFEFSEFLTELEKDVNKTFSRWPRNWKEFGCLRFEKPLTQKQASKFKFGQIGLAGVIASRLRDFTSIGTHKIYSGNGQPPSTDGKPCWPIVAEFVNAAFTPDPPVTEEGLRTAWSALTKNNTVSFRSWPGPPIREEQLFRERISA
jgi:hypothetical protein